MSRNNFLLLPAIIGILSACHIDRPEVLPVSIIPQPVRMTVNPGCLRLDKNTAILYYGYDDRLAQTAALLSARLRSMTGFPFRVDKSDKAHKNSIFLKLDTSRRQELGEEGYILHSSVNHVEIIAPGPAGIFYGTQTLYQLMPAGIIGTGQDECSGWTVPCVEITDYPEFTWRGMHLDVSRHFFPVAFIKKYIDLIAMHKMNTFHWHLTDDNGWRIEIKEYPLLAEISAWRVDRESRPWGDREPQQPGEKAAYGGYYTQEEIREVVKYASERYVRVIPEIEMPGHTSEVFAAYPLLSCRSERLRVQPGSYWPITDIFCAGKEETFDFIENVLKEVAFLFPGDYIHIGGDEADKTLWETCPFCQGRIKDENLSDEKELQSYFIKRVEKMLAGMGRKLIGWDEILEGGLAPEATVMSWRGFEGGIESARKGHDVIMCPTDYCYFDYYQADPEFQPEAIGGLTTLKKVYSFKPVPSELNESEARHILGGQGNLWTEYISTPEKAEYMALPRMTALAEVLWTPETRRSWPGFRSRLQSQLERFDQLNVNYSAGSAKVLVRSEFDTVRQLLTVILETEMVGTKMFYTLDGSEPGINGIPYTGPVEIKDDATLKAVARKEGKILEKTAVYDITTHAGTGGKVRYLEQYSERYPGSGSQTLIDGLRGSLDYKQEAWQGFSGKNLDLVISLGRETEIRSISSAFLQKQESWIFLPEQVSYLLSGDGVEFRMFAVTGHDIPQDTAGPVIHHFTYEQNLPVRAKYIRVTAVSSGLCPDWHEGKGQPSWIFADEIVINQKL